MRTSGRRGTAIQRRNRRPLSSLHGFNNSLVYALSTPQTYVCAIVRVAQRTKGFPMRKNHTWNDAEQQFRNTFFRYGEGRKNQALSAHKSECIAFNVSRHPSQINVFEISPLRFGVNNFWMIFHAWRIVHVRYTQEMFRGVHPFGGACKETLTRTLWRCQVVKMARIGALRTPASSVLCININAVHPKAIFSYSAERLKLIAVAHWNYQYLELIHAEKVIEPSPSENFRTFQITCDGFFAQTSWHEETNAIHFQCPLHSTSCWRQLKLSPLSVDWMRDTSEDRNQNVECRSRVREWRTVESVVHNQLAD